MHQVKVERLICFKMIVKLCVFIGLCQVARCDRIHRWKSEVASQDEDTTLSYLCHPRRNTSTTFFDCNEDCQLSHGAEGGNCVDPENINRFNCDCGKPTGRVPWREQQCIEDTIGYQQLCQRDCQCNHGAVTGRCDFTLKSCHCQGYNPRNVGCPTKDFDEFKNLVRNIFQNETGPIYINFLDNYNYI